MNGFIDNGRYLVVFDYILYIILISVTGWTVYQIIKAPLKERMTQLRYRSQLKQTQLTSPSIPLSKRSKLYRHVYFLLQSLNVSSKRENPDSIGVYGFLYFSGAIGLFTFVLIVVKFHDAFLGLIIGGVISLIPYIIILVKLKTTQNTIGNELTNIIELLIHGYSASSYDIYQALKTTHANIREPELRRLFVKLISDLQTAKNDEEMRLSIDLFIYTAGNSWAMRLGNIILKAYVNQENVLNALLQLQSQMINNEKMLEQEKSGSYDAFANAALGLILFPVSLVGAKFVTRPQSWIHLQFGEKYALLLFIVTTVMVTIAFLVGLLIRKPKNDL